MKLTDVPASRVLYSDYVDLCMCVCVHLIRMFVQACPLVHAHVCVAVAVRLCVSPVSMFSFLQMV